MDVFESIVRISAINPPYFFQILIRGEIAVYNRRRVTYPFFFLRKGGMCDTRSQIPIGTGSTIEEEVPGLSGFKERSSVCSGDFRFDFVLWSDMGYVGSQSAC